MTRGLSLFILAFLLLVGCGSDPEKPPVTPPQPDTTAPAAVTDLAVSATTDSSATLTWTAPGDDNSTGTVTWFDVRYSHMPIAPDRWGAAQSGHARPGHPESLPAGARMSFTVTGIPPGMTYYFALKAADEEQNWSDQSNVATAAVGPDAIPPTGVGDLHAVATTDSSATIAWTATGDDWDIGTASGYDLRIAGTREELFDNRWDAASQVEGEPLPQPTGSAEAMTISGLEPGTTYFARIRAEDEQGNGTRSNIAEIRTTDSEAEAADAHWLDVFGGTGPDDSVTALYPHDGALMVGGGFRFVAGVEARGIARWDGATWQAMGEFRRHGSVRSQGPAAFAEFNGALVAGGPFEWIVNSDQSVSYAMHIAEWRNGSWSELGSGWGTDDYGVTCSAFQPYNGSLVVGGTVIVIGTTYDYVDAWDGTRWHLGGGVSGPVNALTLFRGDLIVAGAFLRTSTVVVRSIVRYDGSGPQGWYPLGAGIGQGAGQAVQALAVFQDELYAAGSFRTAGNHGVGGIAKWNGIEWSRPGAYEDEWDHQYPNISALAVYNGRLIVGGNYSNRFRSCIATWDGTTWGKLGTGIGAGSGDVVTALTVHDGKLYVGGTFTRAGDKTVQNVACWSE